MKVFGSKIYVIPGSKTKDGDLIATHCINPRSAKWDKSQFGKGAAKRRTKHYKKGTFLWAQSYMTTGKPVKRASWRKEASLHKITPNDGDKMQGDYFVLKIVDEENDHSVLFFPNNGDKNATDWEVV